MQRSRKSFLILSPCHQQQTLIIIEPTGRPDLKRVIQLEISLQTDMFPSFFSPIIIKKRTEFKD